MNPLSISTRNLDPGGSRHPPTAELSSDVTRDGAGPAIMGNGMNKFTRNHSVHSFHKPSFPMPLTYVTAEEFAKQKTASGPSSSNRKFKHEKNFVYKSPSKVLSGLYVGNFRDSKDATQLDRFNITHIVAIHDAARKLHPDKHYLCVMASDTPDQNLTQYFPICNDFIHAARLRGGNVLIHCLAGMSRSVTVAVAYIMSVTSLNWKEALKVVRVGRSVANPNSGFQQQLEDFEMTKLYDERRRLKERFPSLALAATDEAECHLILQSYEGLLLSRNLCEGNCAMGEVCPTGLCRSPSKTRGTGRRRSSAQTPPGSPGGRRLPATPILGRHQLSRSPSSLSSAPNSPLGERRSRTAYSAPPSRSGSRVDLLDPIVPMSPLIPRLTSLTSLMPASAPVSPRGSPAHLSRRP